MGILAGFMVPHPPLIVPEIGKGQERMIQKTIDAYHKVAARIGELRPETIVLLSPHQTMYADYFHISPGSGAEGDFGQFRAGNVRIKVSYDTAFVQELCRKAGQAGLAAGTDGELEKRLDHGTMVPLYFVNQYWNAYRLVRIGLSGLPLSQHMALGRLIQDTVRALGRSAVIIASGDLSHRLKADGPYGYQKEGPAYDTRVMDVMGRAAFGELLSFSEDFCSRAGECGHRSFTMMAGALEAEAGASKERPGKEIAAARLSYEGPFGVGYGVCMYEIKEKAPADGR